MRLNVDLTKEHKKDYWAGIVGAALACATIVASMLYLL